MSISPCRASRCPAMAVPGSHYCAVHRDHPPREQDTPTTRHPRRRTTLRIQVKDLRGRQCGWRLTAQPVNDDDAGGSRQSGTLPVSEVRPGRPR